jgi:hypothetical protein
MKTNDEFYIGWQDTAPASISAIIKRLVVGTGLASFALALILAIAQGTIAVSVFEWGKIKNFSGVFRSEPYPRLLVTASDGSQSNYYLVKAFKFGIDPKLAKQFDGKSVALKGTLIYRDNQRMIEAIEDSIKASAFAESAPSSVSPIPLGRQTLVGEIVDSKCYFGVMNPGQFIPHRACAIRCISGGVPPVLVVRHPNGQTSCLLLVSKEGRPLREEILRIIAEPVRITGEVEQDGNLLTLRAQKIERVHGS